MRHSVRFLTGRYFAAAGSDAVQEEGKQSTDEGRGEAHLLSC